MQWTCTGTSLDCSIAEQNRSKSLVSRVLKIDRNMDVRHAETADACRLVWQCRLMCVEPQVDDVADAEAMDVRELRLCRLTGCGYPVIESPPVVDRAGVGHHSLDFGFSGGARRGTRLTGADS